MSFPELDPILHSQLRLAIVSLLVQLGEADFNFLLKKTGASPGNLSVQLGRLRDAGYVEVIKQFKNNYPQTVCRLLQEGESAFRTYVSAISSYIHPKKTI